jgi:hypothetical protein
LIAFSFIAAAMLCICTDAVLSYFTNHFFRLRWSIIVSACIIPVTVILFFVHYRLKKGRNLKRAFHIWDHIFAKQIVLSFVKPNRHHHCKFRLMNAAAPLQKQRLYEFIIHHSLSHTSIVTGFSIYLLSVCMNDAPTAPSTLLWSQLKVIFITL